jgi:hypothetical protein
MGNRTSSVDFSKELGTNTLFEPGKFKINLELEKRTLCLTVQVKDQSADFNFGVSGVVDPNVNTWKPKTNMVDFEIIPVHPEIRIGRGQGIGVLIIDRFNLYLKLYYDKTSPHEGIGFYAATFYTHSHNKKEQCLHSDLSIGYDVFWIQSTGVSNLVDEKAIQLAESQKDSSVVFLPDTLLPDGDALDRYIPE